MSGVTESQLACLHRRFASVVQDPMPADRIRKLGELYKLPLNNNAEVKCK